MNWLEEVNPSSQTIPLPHLPMHLRHHIFRWQGRLRLLLWLWSSRAPKKIPCFTLKTGMFMGFSWILWLFNFIQPIFRHIGHIGCDFLGWFEWPEIRRTLLTWQIMSIKTRTLAEKSSTYSFENRKSMNSTTSNFHLISYTLQTSDFRPTDHVKSVAPQPWYQD